MTFNIKKKGDLDTVPFLFHTKTMIFNLKKKGDLDTVPFPFHTKNHDI